MQRYGFASAPISNGGYMSISLYPYLFPILYDNKETRDQKISIAKSRSHIYPILFYEVQKNLFHFGE